MSRYRTAFRLIATGVVAGSVAAGAAAPSGAVSSLVDPNTPVAARPLVGGVGQSLVFSDEFTASTVDRSRWNVVEQQRGSGNSGVQWAYKAENVRVTNGALALDISKEGENYYGGSRVDTQGRFDMTFGTVEYRMHIPPTEGHLAAAWMQAAGGLTPGGVVDGTARDGAEIDILESNFTDDRYTNTIHWDGYGADHQQSTQPVSAPGLRSTWYHTLTMNWSPTSIQFSYDGKVVRTITDPVEISQVREFLIASNEVIAFAMGDIRNAPLDSTSTVYVDYVRVWQ
jgi:beta-glucanase (GH16 family)